MSRICIGFIKIDEMPFEKDQLISVARENELNILLNMSYEEPIMTYFKNDYIYFNFVDSSMNNCEMLLLPDNCYYNGEGSNILFQERMKKIENFLKELLAGKNKIDIFIGDSGTEYNGFKEISLGINDFSNIATQYLNCVENGDFHFVIAK